MEELKEIGYEAGKTTHGDVRQAINANVEAANGNFSEVAGMTPYAVRVRTAGGAAGSRLVVELDRALGDGDQLRIMRARRPKKKYLDDDVLWERPGWCLACPSFSLDMVLSDWFRPYTRGTGVLSDFSAGEFLPTGGDSPVRYGFYRTDKDPAEELPLHELANFFVAMMREGNGDTYVRITGRSGNNRLLKWPKGEGWRSGGSIRLAVAVVRPIGLAAGDNLLQKLRPYVLRSNLARFDITVDMHAWGFGDDTLDDGRFPEALGFRIR